MADLNIPNLNKKSGKYLFKNKINLNRKSKRKIIIESTTMLIISAFIIYLNYLIPNKVLIFRNFFINFEGLFVISIELLYYLFQIFLVIFIVISLLIASLLILGALYRVIKLLKRKNTKISY